MLTPEQTETIKQRLIAQIESTFPEDRKQFAKDQIEAMDSEQLEQFLIKNNLIRSGGQGQGKENCIFCSIVSGDITSYKVTENKKALAVLEINPMAKSHVIVIPKEHVSSETDMPEEAKKLAKKISSLLKTKLKPETVKIESKNLLGHEVLNVIPIYDSTDSEESKPEPANPDDLKELQETLKKRVQKRAREKTGEKKVIKKRIKRAEKFQEKLWLPKRIP